MSSEWRSHRCCDGMSSEFFDISCGHNDLNILHILSTFYRVNRVVILTVALSG